MSDLVKYSTDAGEVTLSPAIIKQYLCNLASDQEIYMFLKLCESQKLNPFVRDAYLVKYDRNKPGSIVVGWHVFLKRAQKDKAFKGYTAEVYDDKGNPYMGVGKIAYATATVYRSDRDHPVVVRVLFNEYSTGNGPWVKIPATMIRKVALEQALREAFPQDLAGMYGPEEMREDPEALPKGTVTVVENNGHKAEPGPVATASTVVEEVEDEIDVDAEIEGAHEEAEVVPPVPKRTATQPFAVVKFLAQSFGASWSRAKVMSNGKEVPATEHFFGKHMQNISELSDFASAQPEVWEKGAVALAEYARQRKSK